MKKPATAPAKQQTPIAQNWSGPLPPPEALARFDQIIPNGAERILRMTEQEQAHRLAAESAALNANIQANREAQAQAKTGQFAGAIVSILAILSAIASAWLGAHPTVSIALVSVPILGMVKALIGTRLDK
ncbi:MAG: DUF2335 domain-containing protein [Sulfuritalea sp.]|nr:DUF2335 domain-containing protein [Sulfuritalea sp.]